MNTTIKKWGNSVAARIPKEALDISNLSLNDSVEVISFPGSITLQKKTTKTWREIAQPIVNTKDWVFNREKENERL